MSLKCNHYYVRIEIVKHTLDTEGVAIGCHITHTNTYGPLNTFEGAMEVFRAARSKADAKSQFVEGVEGKQT